MINEGDYSFKVFVESIFNHDVKNPEWYWNSNWVSPPYSILVIFIKELYENAEIILKPYSDQQIEQGMQFMLFPGVSECHRALCIPSVSLLLRTEAVLSIAKLFDAIYCKKCSNVSTFSGVGDLNPLNNSCFMWWDTSPLIGSSDIEIIEACLKVMESCLYMSNIVCQESALHGLGHLVNESIWESRCKKIIEKFLKSSNKNVEKLESYARSAYQGCVQ